MPSANSCRQSKLGDGLAAALRKLTEFASLDVAAIYLFNERAKSLRPAVAVGLWADQFHRSAPIEIPAELFDQLRQIHPTLLPGSAAALPEALRLIQQQENIRHGSRDCVVVARPHDGHDCGGMPATARVFSRRNESAGGRRKPDRHLDRQIACCWNKRARPTKPCG